MSRSIRPATRLLLATLCLIVFGLGPSPAARGIEQEGDGKQQPMSFWMKKKLDYSQSILGGIASADFDKIVENAQAMRNLSKVEGFFRGQTAGYRTQLQIFDEANAEIIRQAQRDNVEGATLAFTQLTVSCVNCHKHLRERAEGK